MNINVRSIYCFYYLITGSRCVLLFIIYHCRYFHLYSYTYYSVPLVPCLLTYSMVQSPSWEAKWFAVSQEIPRISRNPKVHYRTHKPPPPVSILGQPNPVHIPTSHLLEIRPNIIHPSMPRSSLVVSFPPVSPPRPYTPHSSHPYAPHVQPISFSVNIYSNWLQEQFCNLCLYTLYTLFVE